MSTEYSHEFNTLLGGEISAVETYDLALKREMNGQELEALNECRASHARRVELLTQYVIDNGGQPKASDGVWGAFAAMVQNTASSPEAALACLEQFEAERLVQYEAQREIVPAGVNAVLVNELLPAQHETHLIVSTLNKAAEAAQEQRKGS